MIAGIPGIGKTTLAQVLAVEHAQIGYEVVMVSEDIDEADRVWDPEVPQFFYYDDFLGQTTLEDKLGKNEDQRLLSFMSRVSRSDNKRIVLTTREYILEQARQRHEPLTRIDFDPTKCVVDLADYTARIRAEILYNHVFFSDVARDEKAMFARARVYERIIEHPNFSPRLVSLSLRGSYRPNDEMDASRHLLATLDDPSSLWDHVVQHQLGDDARWMLVALASLPVEVGVGDLEPAWTRIIERVGGSPPTTRRFRDALRTIDGTMVRTDRHGLRTSVQFHNPSIRDYMSRLLVAEPTLVARIVDSAVFFEQLAGLQRMATYLDGGQAILNALRSCTAELDDSLVSRFSATAIDGPQPWSRVHGGGAAGRARSMLWFVRRLELPRSRDALRTLLAHPDRLLLGTVDYSALTRLGQEALDAERDIDPKTLDAYVEWVVELLVDSASDLDELAVAIDHLAELPDFGVAEQASENLRERFLELAEHELEDWMAQDDLGAGDASEVRDILERVEQVLGHRTSVGDELSDRLDEIESSARSTVFGAEPVDADDDQGADSAEEDDAGYIAGMFTSLAD